MCPELFQDKVQALGGMMAGCRINEEERFHMNMLMKISVILQVLRY